MRAVADRSEKRAGSPGAFDRLSPMHRHSSISIAQDPEKSSGDETTYKMFSLKRMGTFIDLRARSHISTWLVSIAINEALMRIASRRLHFSP